MPGLPEYLKQISTPFAEHPLTNFLIDQIEMANLTNFPGKHNLLATFEEYVLARGYNVYLENLANDSRGKRNQPKCVQYASLILTALFTEKAVVLNSFYQGNSSLDALIDFYDENRENDQLKDLTWLCLAGLAHAGVDLSQCYGIANWQTEGLIESPLQWIIAGTYSIRLEANKQPKPEDSSQ
ncbi:MAG: hypothetical protein WC227_03370 [Patescibacteria group bacterium]|jgi:hypothetical protein